VKNTAPASDAFRQKIAAFPAEKPRTENRRIGSIGVAVALSKATKATVAATPATKAVTTSALPQPTVLLRTSAQASANAAAVTSPRPGRSSGAAGTRLLGIRVSTSGIVTTAIGTLIQKIHCQAIPCVTAPPTTGPSAAARPVTLPYTPIARPRCCGGNAAFSRLSARGITTAAPTPCKARAATSAPMFVDNAHAADAAANRPSPAAYVPRRP